MKYIMSNGAFVCRENNNEVVSSISGKIIGFRTVTPDGESEKVQIDLAEGDGDDAVVRTLNLKKYGDASLKILRCLFGIAEIIRDKVITISLEEREGHSALISVSADGELLTPCGSVEPYAYDKKLLTDKTILVLKRCFDFKKTILVYANRDNVLDDFDDNVESVAEYILDLRRSGRENELTVKKVTFTSVSGANAYLKALRDLQGVAPFRYTCDEDAIALIWEAFTKELPVEEPAPASGEVDDETYEG